MRQVYKVKPEMNVHLKMLKDLYMKFYRHLVMLNGILKLNIPSLQVNGLLHTSLMTVLMLLLTTLTVQAESTVTRLLKILLI